MPRGSKKGVTFADRHSAPAAGAAGAGAGAAAAAADDAIGRRRSLAADATTAATDFVLPKPDNHRQPNQAYCVMSYCAPEGARVRCKKVAIKISGSFPSEDEAQKAAETIRNEDNRFDVHVIPLYEWGTVPMSEDVKPLVRKEYTDKYMTKVMSGLQQSLAQSRKEMDDRIARDRAKSEMEMRKKLGPDYVAAAQKPEKVKEYEEETMKRDEQTKDMTFTQRDLIESFAKYMSGGCGGGAKIDPSAAGNFIRFMEAQKMANKTFAEADANGTPGVDSVAIVVNNGDSPPADCAPAAMPAAPAAGSSAPAASCEDAPSATPTQ